MNAAYPLRAELLQGLQEAAEVFLRWLSAQYPEGDLRISFAGGNHTSPPPTEGRSVTSIGLRATVQPVTERRLGLEDGYRGTVAIVLDAEAQSRVGEEVFDAIAERAEQYFKALQVGPCGQWAFHRVARIVTETTTTGALRVWQVEGEARWRVEDAPILKHDDERFPLLHDDDFFPLEVEP